MTEKKEVNEHIQKHTITEFLHYPGHEGREETKWFRNAKKELENVEHLGCFQCGKMTERQSHHIFERAWANGLDFKKVAYFLYNHFDFHGHCHRDFENHEELLNFFITHFNGKVTKGISQYTGLEVEYVSCDDDALDTLYNQLILCREHHVGENVGVHYKTAPSFFAGLAERPDFDTTLTQEEAEELLRKGGHPSKHTR